MHRVPPSVSGHRLGASEYIDDFWPRFRLGGDIFWKLERRQEFREPDVPSWRAMMSGDWDEALRLINEMEPDVKAELAARPFDMRRVRIVDDALTPYLQWEMWLLRLRVEAGERIRVVRAADIAEWEREYPLPELVLLGHRTMYEVLYDVDGGLAGATRTEDADLIDGCRDALARLFDLGEDFRPYFRRAVAGLPPPVPLTR